MCGLAGSLISPGISAESLDRIKEIFIANLLANEERGEEATGVAVSWRDGRMFYEKAAVPASEFVQSVAFKQFMGEAVNDKTAILLGHTRDPTKGSTADNLNNHPIIVGNTVGVHNGTIKNDDEIFGDLVLADDKVKRLGAVDTEAIIALFDQASDCIDRHSYVSSIKGSAQLLTGSFTTLFFNSMAPQRLICLRYNNPISSHYHSPLQTLFFSSRYLFLRKTFGRETISQPMSAKTGFVYEADRLIQSKGVPEMEFELSSC